MKASPSMCFVSLIWSYMNHTKGLAGVNRKVEYILLAADEDLPEVSTVILELVGIHQSSSSWSADLQSARVIQVNVNTMIKVSQSVFPPQHFSSAKLDKYQLMCSWLEASCKGSSELCGCASTYIKCTDKHTQSWLEKGQPSYGLLRCSYCHIHAAYKPHVSEAEIVGLFRGIHLLTNPNMESTDSQMLKQEGVYVCVSWGGIQVWKR